MAEKSDGNPKDTALGEREQFDSFDRLQKVDQKDLNVDKLKATDKDSDSEELLATKDRTHIFFSFGIRNPEKLSLCRFSNVFAF